MLRTNSKKAIENLKKWTVEHFDADGYNDFNGDENNFSDCAKYIYRVSCVKNTRARKIIIAIQACKTYSRIGARACRRYLIPPIITTRGARWTYSAKYSKKPKKKKHVIRKRKPKNF